MSNTTYPNELLKSLGIINPENVTTKQASRYLTEIKGIPIRPSTLEVYRSTGRGARYRKINARVYYSLQWLDEYAAGIEVKIFDPSKGWEVM